MRTTQKADSRARIVLPPDFANTIVIIERVGPNELRLQKTKRLSQLVAGITPENCHREWNTGPLAGREIL